MDRRQKRKLEEWSLIVSLPLAIASILSIVLPPAVASLKGDYSELKVTLAKSNFEKLQLLITNTGNQPAVINSVILDASEGPHTDKTFIAVADSVRLVKSKEHLVISSRDDDLIHASVDMFSGKTDLPIRNCRVLIQYQQFDSTPAKAQYEFRCYLVDHSASAAYANLMRKNLESPVTERIYTASGSQIVVDKKLISELLALPADIPPETANPSLQGMLRDKAAQRP